VFADCGVLWYYQDVAGARNAYHASNHLHIGGVLMATRDYILSEAEVQRFWSRVDMSGDPYSCWPWKAGKSEGYGRFGFGSKKEGNAQVEYAHRLSWMLTSGPISNGLYVCHKCDVRGCCNPRHLFLGTHIDNMQDAIDKGRLWDNPEYRHRVIQGIRRAMSKEEYRRKKSKEMVERWKAPQWQEKMASIMSKTMAKVHIGYVAPDGTRPTIYNMRQFCLVNDLDETLMYAIKSGKRKQYKGWHYEG